MSTIVFDVEANGLLYQADKIHCICLHNVDQKESRAFDGHDIPLGIDALFEADVIVGHNIIEYDLPLIKKLHGKEPKEDCLILDTVILSRYAFPDRQLPEGCPTVYYDDKGKAKRVGPHSLAAWGYREGNLKPEHSDWMNYSPEMLHRCKEDVRINVLTLYSLCEELGVYLEQLTDKKAIKWFAGGHDKSRYPVCSPVFGSKLNPINGYWLEVKFAQLCMQQQMRKCKLDLTKLYSNMDELKGIIQEIVVPIEEDLGLYAEPLGAKVAYNGYMKGRVQTYAEEHCGPAYAQALFSSMGDLDGIIEILERRLGLDSLPQKQRTKTNTLRDALEECKEYMGKPCFVKKPFMKNGDLTANVQKYIKETDMTGDVRGPFSKVDFPQLKLSQREKVANVMLRRGWRPSSYTEVTEKGGGGNPQLTVNGDPCPNLANVPGGLGLSYIKWVKATKRLEMHQAFYDNMDEHGMIPALVNSVGTNTYRVTHRLVANLPRAGGGTFYGTETRSVITCPDGYLMLGADMSGLENRVAAHYTYPLDGGEYADLILNGDCHTNFRLKIVESLGKDCPEVFRQSKEGRNVAKGLSYAIIYGCSPKKAASMLGVEERVAKKILDSFWKANPALATLKAYCEQSHEEFGYVAGIDGRKIITRSSHSAMNALFQSAGSIIFKIATCAAHEKSGRTMEQQITYHDENQWRVLESEVKTTKPMSKEKLTKVLGSGKILGVPHENEDAEFVCKYHPHGELFVKAAKYAGKVLRCDVEFTAEYDIGDSWADTH